MNILIITLLLVVSIKRTFGGGLFIGTYKELNALKKKAEAAEATPEDLAKVIKMLLVALFLLAMQIYSLCLGITIAPLVIPTILMFAHMIFCSMNKNRIEDIGKYSIGSVAENLASVVYYAYFLYVLI